MRDCAPEDVTVGSRVRVVFEHHADVWLPQFVLVPDVAVGPVPEDDPPAPVHSCDGDVAQVRA